MGVSCSSIFVLKGIVYDAVQMASAGKIKGTLDDREQVILPEILYVIALIHCAYSSKSEL